MTPNEKTFPLFIKGLPAAWDESATTQNIVLSHPPHIGREGIHFRWWGTRQLIALETCAEIIALMTPLELLIAQARIDGLPDTEIADLMRITPNAVSKHMTRLRQRICQHFPEIRPLLAGRRYRSP